MTKPEALAALKAGHQIRHATFTDDEFIELSVEVHNSYLDEQGYCLNIDEFWSYRTDKNFEDNWYII